MPNEPIDGDGLYRRLGVSTGASHEEIVRAYRRLARTSHPDAHPEDPGAAERFRDLTEAYDVLSDPARRASYDRRSPQVVAGPALKGPVLRRDPPVRPSVVLGQQPSRGPLRQIWAGPVHVDPDPDARTSGRTYFAAESDVANRLAWHLLSELFDSWWG